MADEKNNPSHAETVAAEDAHQAATVTVSPEALDAFRAAPGTREPINNIVTPECPGRYTMRTTDPMDAEIGRGGIGRILAVYDEHLQREVAAKEINPDGLISPRGGDTCEYASSKIARFLREARITGQLIHPNIVPVYEVGMRGDGSLYYTMRLVRGKTFKQALRGCEGLEDRLKLLSHFVDLCNAIAFAHSRDVIHRDIKPDNVMLGEFGETLVLDWGLAKVLTDSDADEDAGRGAALASTAVTHDSSASLTVDGSFMGTPSYASPEQVAGNLSLIDCRSDIWSLGAMLYEILTGRPPFMGTSVQELLVKVLTEQVVPPHEIDDRIPGDLSSVCVKALDRDLEARYPDARLLAEEIEAFRSGRRVLAHEYSPWEHLKRFAAQKKGLIATVASIVAVVIVSLVIVSASYSSERTARKDAQQATAREQRARAKERQEKLRSAYHFAQGAAEKAGRLSGEKRHLSASIYAAASLAQNPAHPSGPLHDPGFEAIEPQSRDLLLSSLARLIQASSASFVNWESDLAGDIALNSCDLSPDGRIIAEASRTGLVRLRDADMGKLISTMPGHEGDVTAALFSPSGDAIASAGKDGKVTLWDTASAREIRPLREDGEPILSMAWAPDGSQVALGTRDGKVELRSVDTGDLMATLEGHTGAVMGLDYSPDGKGLVTGSRDRSVRLWDLPTCTGKAVLEGHTSVVSDVAWSAKGDLVASSSYDKTARVWEVAEKRVLFVAEDHSDEVMSVDFSPDGRVLLTGCWDRSARLLDSRSGAMLTRVDAHDDAVLEARFARDGKRILTTPNSGPTRIWSLGSRPPFLAAPGQGFLWSARYSPDGNLVATAGQDGAIRLWNASSGALLRELLGHEDLVQSIFFSFDGSLLASGGYDRKLRIWKVSTGELLSTLEGHTDLIRSVAISSDGSVVASAGKEGAYIFWSVDNGDELGRLDEKTGQARSVAFSEDGKWFASGGDGGVVQILDASTRKPLRDLSASEGKITSLAFSPNGEMLAASTWDGKIMIWKTGTWDLVATLSRGTEAVYTVVFSGDGALLAAAGDDAVVAIWSLGEARPILLYRVDQSIFAIDLSPDGKNIVMGNFDTAQIYPLEPGMLDKDPVRLLEGTERAAGQILDGFNLVAPRKKTR